MTTYEDVHAGDLVLGNDPGRQTWGVEHIAHAPRLAVTLVRHGAQVTGYPPPGTEVTIVQRADVSAEFWAAQIFIGAGLDIEIVSEHWTHEAARQP